MAKLPVLIYNDKTRVGAEVLIYYNLGVGKLIGHLTRGNGTVNKLDATPCASNLPNPVGGFAARVVTVENQGTIDGIPAQAPLYTAEEIDGTYSEDITAYAATIATDGDSVDIITFPDPANDQLICFDQGFSFTPSPTLRAIPRKFNSADHWVRQRSDVSFSLSDLMVSNWDGIQRIRGRRCTLIVKFYPSGTALPSEIQYYTNVVVNPQTVNSPSEGNDSVSISVDGTGGHTAVFAAQEA